MHTQLFQDIKQLFFPRWDPRGDWILEELDDLNGAEGCCRMEEKKIQIRTSEGPSVQVELLLVHEICHAVANGHHGKLWLRRMEKAAQKAEQLKKRHLAAAINSEIDQHKSNNEVCSASLFYEILRDLVFLNSPGLAEQELLIAVGRTIGLSYDEVIDTYPRALRVIRFALREAEAGIESASALETTLGMQAS